MHVHRRANGFDVAAPAKLNLFLEVLARRPDGFHEIETLMVPVSLVDSLSVVPTPSGPIELDCSIAVQTGGDALPAASENLAVRALQRLREAAGISAGARVRLVKRIPWASGLGGGSSDAAAALAAGNAAWNLNWPTDRLVPLAAELGSDVPFFLSGGAAICRGRGEQIEPIGPLGPLSFVVVRPPEGLSTPAVYRGCRPAAAPRSAALLVAALKSGCLARVAATVHNALEEPAARLCHWIGRLQKVFAELGCVAHQMSGSGSAYFGICRQRRQARRIAATLRSRSLGQTWAVGATF